MKRVLIAIIAVCVVVTACITVVVLHDKNKPGEDSNRENSTVATKADDVDRKSDELSNAQTETSQIQRYRVIFYDSSDIPIAVSITDDKMSVVPPDFVSLPPGKVFTGWDGDFEHVEKDMEVRPKYTDISSVTNAIYMDSVYATNGSNVTMKISLSGKVELSGLQMYIKYDASQVELLSCNSTDAGSMVNASVEESAVKLAYISTENTTGDVELAEVTFKVVGESGSQAKIELIPDKAAKVDLTGNVVNADCSFYGAVVYIYGGTEEEVVTTS